MLSSDPSRITKRAIVISAYVSPSNKKDCMLKIRAICRDIARRYKGETMILSGDFNQSRSKLEKYMAEIGFISTIDPPDWKTW